MGTSGPTNGNLKDLMRCKRRYVQDSVASSAFVVTDDLFVMTLFPATM